MTFSSLKRLAIVLPISFLFLLWVVVHGVLRRLHQFPDILILGAIVTVGVVAFAFAVFEVVNRLERQIVSQNRQLRALLRVGRAASSSLMVGELLDAAIGATLDILHADAAAVWLLDSDGRLRMARHCCVENLDPEVTVQDVPPDLEKGHDPSTLPVELAARGFQSYRALALRHRKELVGMLSVGAKSPDAFSGKWQRELLEGIGEWISMALANAQLHEEALDGAVLDERLRIARELHDGVAQVLTYANAQTMAVQRLLDEDRSKEARDELGAMERATRQVYGDVHEAILGLRTSLERPGLVPALEESLAQFERIAGSTPRLLLPESIDMLELPAPTEVQLVRIVQEALANVRKHAAASSVTVQLESCEGSLQVTIADDGRGFNPATAEPTGWPHFGLQTMRERAQALAGSFEVKSRPGAGTQVIVTVPVTEAKVGEVADLASR